jgi:zinc transport system substrate-binding protein
MTINNAMRPRRFHLAVALTSFLITCTCATAEPVSRVIVSILPQKEFVQRIAGDGVQIDVLVKPGDSPATYAPTLRQMSAIGRADVLFQIGVPFENSILPEIRDRFPELRIVDCRHGITLRQLEANTPNQHVHSAQCDHAHEGDDPHIWLDPVNVTRISATIRDTLVQIDPAGKTRYDANYEQFAESLDRTHQRIVSMLAPFSGRKVYAFHPAYGYFADAYALQQVAVETGGNEPSPRHLSELIRQARQDQVRVIFVQPQFSQRAARTLADQAGAAVVALDPLAGDYLANLQRIAESISAALK